MPASGARATLEPASGSFPPQIEARRRYAGTCESRPNRPSLRNATRACLGECASRRGKMATCHLTCHFRSGTELAQSEAADLQPSEMPEEGLEPPTRGL